MRRAPADGTTPSATLTREPDEVGKPGSGAVGGGRQKPEQAAITGTGEAGRTDASRSRDRPDAGGAAGRNPVPVGGSSGGHSDQHSASGGGKVADGHDDVEKDRG